MLKKDSAKQIVEFIGYLMTLINAVIVFRLLTLSISVDWFRDDMTGKLSTFGYDVKFFQIIIENLTNPLINPLKSIILSFENFDSGLVNIVAPVLVIILLFICSLVLKMITPYILSFFRDEEDDFFARYR